ncbi:anti-sigma factor [Sphaerisporangium corydalis]|uniref:Zf-HC2 domain-containing protein n=1 Tax=Sphaerisporangium corydalis TaxID=1441875 RepID=A0ABV9EUA2_9ACTN|nr:zf-HC2 domain-containing protein [Sphaerisporangium corydalis]
MSADDWHVADDDLRAYADGAARPPWLWSAEAHLGTCPHCRRRLARCLGPAVVHAGWARLDAELDAPRPGPAEALLVRLGVAAHTARLLACTPGLRRSWLAAVGFTLAVTTGAAHLGRSMTVPIPLLAIAPLLPLIGVAISFGPRVDPSHELAVVAPLHTFRLLMLRCASVLAATTALTGVASVAVPESGAVALGWLAPSLALTLLSLALMPRLGPVTAPVAVGSGWLALLGATVQRATGESVLFTAPGQAGLAAGAAVAALALWKARSAFDTTHHLGRVADPSTRRTM